MVANAMSSWRQQSALWMHTSAFSSVALRSAPSFPGIQSELDGMAAICSLGARLGFWECGPKHQCSQSACIESRLQLVLSIRDECMAWPGRGDLSLMDTCLLWVQGSCCRFENER